MFEVIRDAVIWIMSWFVDRRLHTEEAYRLLFLVGIGILATLLLLYWRSLAYRSSAVRRRLMSEERYAGRYLQALWRNGEVRYSFVNIVYNARKRRYEVTGRTYSPAGELLGSFKSLYILFPSRKEANIEFMWHSSSSSKGYTRMTLEDSGEDYVQGNGSVITFDAWPRAYPLRFKHLQDDHVREALGIRSPASSREEPGFIRKFHEAFGATVMEGFRGGSKTIANEAQPLQEGGKLTCGDSL